MNWKERATKALIPGLVGDRYYPNRKHGRVYIYDGIPYRVRLVTVHKYPNGTVTCLFECVRGIDMRTMTEVEPIPGVWVTSR
jgi:hypothetical protein